MSIPRATTPTLALTFSKDDLDLTTAQNVYVTLEQGEKSLTKSWSVINVTAKAWKKVNGTWTQQSDLTTVFQTGVNYVKG